MLDLIIIIAVIVVVIYFIFLRRILRILILLSIPNLYFVLDYKIRVSIVFHCDICTNPAKGYEWWENKHNQSK